MSLLKLPYIFISSLGSKDCKYIIMLILYEGKFHDIFIGNKVTCDQPGSQLHPRHWVSTCKGKNILHVQGIVHLGNLCCLILKTMFVGSHIKPFISNNTNSLPCQYIKTMNARQDNNVYFLGHMAQVCTKPHSISQAFMCCRDNATWQFVFHSPTSKLQWLTYLKFISQASIQTCHLKNEPTTDFSFSPSTPINI